MKQKITTRLLATLLLAVGSLAAIPLTTVLTGCAEEELFNPAPAETAPGGKHPGEIAIHLNVPPLTGFGEAGTRTPGSGTGDHDPGKTSWAVGDELMMQLGIQGDESGGYTTFTYTIFTTAIYTQAGDGTTPQWQLSATPQKIYRSATDEQSGAYVLMPPTFNPFGEQGQFILPAELERCTTIIVTATFSYAPGTRWVTESSGSDIAPDLSLPTAATTGTFEKWRLRDELSNGTEFLEPIGATDNATEAARKRKDNATRLANLFTLDLSKDRDGGTTNAFVHDKCGRLRIATFPGATVQIASKGFIPAAAMRTFKDGSFEAEAVPTTAIGDPYINLDGTTPIVVDETRDPDINNNPIIPADIPVYTTTADALGNAYFYGELNDGSYGELDGTTDKEFIVSVSLPATGIANSGSPTENGAKQVIFRATTKAKVKLANRGSVKIDGNTVNTGKIYAVNVSECADAVALTAELVAAHAAGQTVWTVTGNASDKWSGGTNTSSTAITEAIRKALNAIYGTNPTARISLHLPTITTITSSAFFVNTNGSTNGGLLLQSITAPAATTINKNAFNGCTALTTAHLPVATSIDFQAFYGCTELTTAYLPAATSIADKAFYGCVALTTAHLPVATSIAGNAFQDCKALTTAHLPVATTIGYYAFGGCEALTTAHLPAATSIDSYAFLNCKALTTIDLPVAETIGTSAFNGCKVLTTAYLPAAASIGNQAFQDCKALTTAHLPVATKIGTSTFRTCTSLTTAHLPVATTIGDYAFYNCEALTTAHLPVATTIGDYAFNSCKALTTLRFGTSAITKWGNQILGFTDTPNITLTLAPGQKDFKQDGTGAVEPETPVQFGTGKSFAEYEFKEIKQAK